MNQWPHKEAGTPVALYSAVLAQGDKPQKEGKKRVMHRPAGSFLKLSRQPSIGTTTESQICHPPTDSGTAGLSTLISSFGSHRQQGGRHVGRKEGEAAWELGGHKDNKAGRVKEPDTTSGSWYYLGANAKELLLEQDNLSCNDRVNFKLAESFWDFFTFTVKSLGLAVANYNNMR